MSRHVLGALAVWLCGAGGAAAQQGEPVVVDLPQLTFLGAAGYVDVGEPGAAGDAVVIDIPRLVFIGAPTPAQPSGPIRLSSPALRFEGVSEPSSAAEAPAAPNGDGAGSPASGEVVRLVSPTLRFEGVDD